MEETETNEQIPEKSLNEEIKELVEGRLKQLLEQGVQVEDIDYFGKLVDIHKDIENEDYWKIKKEVLKYDVR